MPRNAVAVRINWRVFPHRRNEAPMLEGHIAWKECDVSCLSANDSQLARLADAIAQRVGQQRFHVWFNNSTKLDLKQDGLEIAVPNDFISEWIGTHFVRSIQEAAHEVLGCSLPVRFSVVPQLFEIAGANGDGASADAPVLAKPVNGNGNGHANGNGKLLKTNGNGRAVKVGRAMATPTATSVTPNGRDVEAAVAILRTT